jgi:hypothetical protein
MSGNPEIGRIEELTRRLDQVNREVERLISRLPLDNHHSLAKLDRLIKEQMQLASTPPRWAIPPRVSVFFDNARNKASFLRQQYIEAYLNGNLRKSQNNDE